MGFSRQEYYSGLLFPPPGDLPKPGIEPAFFCVSCIDTQILYQTEPPGNTLTTKIIIILIRFLASFKNSDYLRGLASSEKWEDLAGPGPHSGKLAVSSPFTLPQHERPSHARRPPLKTCTFQLTDPLHQDLQHCVISTFHTLTLLVWSPETFL